MNTFIVEAENYKTLQTENVNISEYGITPDSVYSIKFEKGQDDTLMPQYQVRYPTHEEIADELWNWLEEYGCLEPYQKVQQYYEDYQAMYPAYNQGELYCYPGKVAYLSYYGDEIVIIQNNMEFSYSGPAIYSKEEKKYADLSLGDKDYKLKLETLNDSVSEYRGSDIFSM